MRLLGNMLWHFPFLGFVPAICSYLLGFLLTLSVVAAPLGLGLIEFGRFLFVPFSYSMVSKTALGETQNPLWAVYCNIIMILYLPFGLLLTACAAIQVAIMFLSIFGIPVAIVYAKSVGTFLNPVNKRCVPRVVAEEITRRENAALIQKHLGNVSISGCDLELEHPNMRYSTPNNRGAQGAMGIALIILGLGFASLTAVRGAAVVERERINRIVHEMSLSEYTSPKQLGALFAMNAPQTNNENSPLIFKQISKSLGKRLQNNIFISEDTSQYYEVAEQSNNGSGDSRLLVIRGRNQDEHGRRSWHVVSEERTTGKISIRLFDTSAHSLAILPGVNFGVSDLQVNDKIIAWDGEKYRCVSKDIPSTAVLGDFALCEEIESEDAHYSVENWRKEDLDLDGTEDIVAIIGGTPKGGGNLSITALGVLLGNKSGFSPLEILGTGMLKDLGVDHGRITATTLTWGEGDANCCPSKRKRVQFGLREGKIVQLDTSQ